jgi:hypothetical protein
MTKRASRGATALMAGSVIALLSGAALAAPVKPGQQQGLGLTGAKVPDELKKIAADPYAAPGDCDQINREVAELDRILGPDRDSAEPPKSSTVGTTVAPLVRSFIPYRNVVRFVTGANRKDDELTQAALVGWERRGFLKGLQKHCNAPDEAAFVTGAPAADLAPQPGGGAPSPVRAGPPDPHYAPTTEATDYSGAAEPTAFSAPPETPGR